MFCIVLVFFFVVIGSRILLNTRRVNETRGCCKSCIKESSLEKVKIFADGSCLLCFEEFQDSDEVVQLNCNTLHIYHADCLQKYVEEGEKEECPLCKASFVFYV